MNNFTEILNEKSLNRKHKELDFSKNFFINGKKKYKGVVSFGIMTPENPSSTYISNKNNKHSYNEFKKFLKNCGFNYVSITGYYNDNIENSFLIFNVRLDWLQRFAGKYNQTSFFYCYKEGDKIISEYWEKKNQDLLYSENSNNYIFINKSDVYHIDKEAENYTIISNNFKFNIDDSIFNKINESILSNAETFMKNTNRTDLDKLLWECTNLLTGQKSCYLRSNIYTYRED